jgi:hypothetical protein
MVLCCMVLCNTVLVKHGGGTAWCLCGMVL